MLYIDKNTDNILIPCNISKGSTEYTLLIKGLSNVEYEYDVVDAMTSSLYYNFTVSIDIPSGEYKYQLFNGDNVVASGLLQYGLNDSEPSVEKKYYQRNLIRKYYNK